jgi:hypothetical protein
MRGVCANLIPGHTYYEHSIGLKTGCDTRAQVTVIIAEACTARVETVAHERVVLLATAHGEIDTVEEKIPSLAVEVAAANQ